MPLNKKKQRYTEKIKGSHNCGVSKSQAPLIILKTAKILRFRKK